MTQLVKCNRIRRKGKPHFLTACEISGRKGKKDRWPDRGYVIIDALATLPEPVPADRRVLGSHSGAPSPRPACRAGSCMVGSAEIWPMHAGETGGDRQRSGAVCMVSRGVWPGLEPWAIGLGDLSAGLGVYRAGLGRGDAGLQASPMDTIGWTSVLGLAESSDFWAVPNSPSWQAAPPRPDSWTPVGCTKELPCRRGSSRVRAPAAKGRISVPSERRRCPGGSPSDKPGFRGQGLSGSGRHRLSHSKRKQACRWTPRSRASSR